MFHPGAAVLSVTPTVMHFGVAAQLPAASMPYNHLIRQHYDSWLLPCPSELLIRRGFTPASRYRGSNKWAQPTFQTILSNSAYMGQHVAYRRSAKTEHERDEETGEMRLVTETKLRADDDVARVVLSPEVCPAIVSEEI